MRLSWTLRRNKELTRHIADRMTHKDIGKVMGCSENAISQQIYASKAMPKSSPATYGERKLAAEAQSKWSDFVSTALKCNRNGLGIKTGLGIDGAFLLIWKGSISCYDEDTMTVVLNETIP